MRDIFSNRQKKIQSAFLTAFLIFVIAFLVYHLSPYLRKPYETETVTSAFLTDEIALDGFFIRDEQVVAGSHAKGVMKCNYEDGQRVRKGSNLMSIYGSQQDQINLQLVKTYTAEYEQLKELSGEGAVKGSRIDIIVKQIEQLQLEYVEQIERGNFSKALEIKGDLTYQLNKLQLCKGEAEDYGEAMQLLQDRITALNSSSPTDNIPSPANGYFSGQTDGFEERLSLESAEKLSAEDAEQILSESVHNGNGSGKIVVSNDWIYCAVAETSDLTQNLHIGQKLNVRFGSLSTSVYPLELIRLEENENGRTLLMFKSSIMNKGFVNARFEKASITVAEYEGIGISKAALRFKNGEKGVYIVRGNHLLFRKVIPVYEDEDIVISAYSTDMEYVSLYDQVVIGGELIGGEP